MANTIEQYGITWTFDKNLSADGAGDTYRYGQFVNGDYWVLVPSEGVVNVIEITPKSDEYQFHFEPDENGISGSFVAGQSVTQATTGAFGEVVVQTIQGGVCIEPDTSSAAFEAGYEITGPSGSFTPDTIVNRIPNGSMINPSGWVSSIPGEYYSQSTTFAYGTHGFDTEMHKWQTIDKRTYPTQYELYDSTLNVARYNDAPISPENPLVIDESCSLVSSISKSSPTRTVLEAQAVITFVDAVPAENSFRPSWSGTDKTSYFAEDDLIDLTGLPGLAPVANIPSLSDCLPQFERPWIDFMTSQTGQSGKSSNMPEYGTVIGQVYAEAALRLAMNVPGEDLGQKRLLQIRLTQIGIDYYGLSLASKRAIFGMWSPGEGQNMGRKFPIVFAGAMLGDTAMQNIGTWWTTADCVQEGGVWYFCRKSHKATSDTKPGVGENWNNWWYVYSEVPEQPNQTPLAGQQKTWQEGEWFDTGHVFQEDMNKMIVPEWMVDYYVIGVNKTQSCVVTGTDGNLYRAIWKHTMSNDTRPITGDNWSNWWEKTREPIYRSSSNLKVWTEGSEADAVIVGGNRTEQYKDSHLGFPEWSTRFYGLDYAQPIANGEMVGPNIHYSDASWTANYRSLCFLGEFGVAMAIHIYGLSEAWGRQVMLDYIDRHYAERPEDIGNNFFLINAWDAYREDYGPLWTADLSVTAEATGIRDTEIDLKATISGGVGTPSVQWQQWNGEAFVDIVGATTAIYTVTGLFAGTEYTFKVIVEDEESPATQVTDTVVVSTTGEESPAQYLLQVGSGITVSGATPVEGNFYEEDTVLTLTAVEGRYTLFTGWSGDASGKRKHIQITMNSTKNITANFVAAEVKSVNIQNLSLITKTPIEV